MTRTDRHGERHARARGRGSGGPGRRVAAALAAAALVAGIAPAANAAPGSTGNERLARKMVREVTAGNAWRHLEALQRVADRNKGIRASGTNGHLESAAYVEGRLRAAGYRTTRQPFTHADFDFRASEGREVAPSARTLHPLVARFSANTPAGGL
ncbi:hypothetical protein AB0J52_42050, partial [Spirillospora sp. NPDC049652]